MSLSNYDNTLIGWNTLDAGETQIPTNITFAGGNSVYCNGETARDNLTNNYSWTITDGGLDCSGLSVDDETLQNAISFYPNPATNILTVESKIPLNKIEIYSILGKKVKEVNSGFNQISVKSLSSGVYSIRIYSENTSAVKKLIKQ